VKRRGACGQGDRNSEKKLSIIWAPGDLCRATENTTTATPNRMSGPGAYRSARRRTIAAMRRREATGHGVLPAGRTGRSLACLRGAPFLSPFPAAAGVASAADRRGARATSARAIDRSDTLPTGFATSQEWRVDTWERVISYGQTTRAKSIGRKSAGTAGSSDVANS